MNTILFISDDFRSGDLLTFLRSHYKGRVKLAPDFDQGLKDVFDNRPSGVFIQSEISGISGETVARHIKTLLRTEAPRIILVHTAPLKPLGGKKWFDDSLDFNQSADELAHALKECVLAISPDLWVDDAAGESNAVDDAVAEPAIAEPPVDAAPSAGDEAAREIDAAEDAAPEFEFNSWDVPVLPTERHAPVEDAAPVYVAAAPVVAEVVPVAVDVVTPPPAAPAEPVQETDPAPAPVPPRPAPSVADFSAPPVAAKQKPRPAVPPFAATGSLPAPAGRKSLRMPLLAVLLVMASAAAAYFLLHTGKPSQPAAAVAPSAPSATTPSAPPAGAPAPTAEPAPAQPAPATHLPAFIPTKERDEAFSRANPGWERYRGKGMEFRVYRESGTVKAVQVIAAGKGGIAESYVAMVLRELTGSEDRTDPARRKKDGYLVESARTAGNGEIVVYRGKGGTIRGIVLSLS
ncbi:MULTISPECIES: hypothetical protein [Geobacter]|uniref:hypothetical protein n=1 Tax=Geobacter TaxID=28231 RepID=UPI0025726B4F|nr:hypothetical protein [Geobacter sulfurreducens]BEH09406.1 hypothetical protein GSUET_10180 [Geobacter sulfurreducens subsp. ethanolicus]BET57288.1 hypothetical protein GEO60473_03280 [Geobacter sp. 60473]HML80020.1 hypothetical protein [Geobacter sulfurreducens]